MQLMDAQQIGRVMEELADRILADAKAGQYSLQQMKLVGIISRGEIIAGRIRDVIAKKAGVKLEVGALDITMYRDDMALRRSIVIPQGTHMNFRVDDVVVILCDDVLDTGRSVRAALDALVDYGRPKAIKVVALTDRNRREFPIAANYVGLKINEQYDGKKIMVRLKPTDEEDQVYVAE